MIKRISAILILASLLFGSDGAFTKTPYEVRDIGIDFLAVAPNGITLDSVQAINTKTLADDTARVIVLAPSTPVPTVLAGTSIVLLRVKNGVDGQSEDILIRVIKVDTGEKIEGSILVNVVKK